MPRHTQAHPRQEHTTTPHRAALRRAQAELGAQLRHHGARPPARLSPGRALVAVEATTGLVFYAIRRES